MKKVLFLSVFTLLLCQPSVSQGVIDANNQPEHLDKVLEWRKQKDIGYANPEKTMLTEELIKTFEGLKYYKVSFDYRVKSNLLRFSDGRTFKISTTGGTEYEYLIFGKVSFEIGGKLLTLDVYQGKRAAQSGKKQGALFIPFTDITSGETTYGGGRYLVLDVPDNDVLVLDFNMAYNPYCVYDPEHSCPIPPKENDLQIKIEAGELMYP